MGGAGRASMKTTQANENYGKVSNPNSEAVVDTYPGNADETTEANEDDGKVSISN